LNDTSTSSAKVTPSKCHGRHVESDCHKFVDDFGFLSRVDGLMHSDFAGKRKGTLLKMLLTQMQSLDSTQTTFASKEVEGGLEDANNSSSRLTSTFEDVTRGSLTLANTRSSMEDIGSKT